MKHVLFLILAGLLALPAAVAAPANCLFSRSLTPEERKASGVSRLSADQIAVLDALVRRESALRAGAAQASGSVPASVSEPFTKSLEPGEIRVAGLDHLTAAEAVRLDALVSRWVSSDEPAAAPVAGEGIDAPRGGTNGSKTGIAWDKPEIHGAVTLEYGAGSGGYSEKTAAVDAESYDPDRRFNFGFGFSESEVKWSESGR